MIIIEKLFQLFSPRKKNRTIYTLWFSLVRCENCDMEKKIERRAALARHKKGYWTCKHCSMLGDKNPFYNKGSTRLGDKNHFFGKHHTDHIKRIMSEIKKDIYVPWIKGKHHRLDSIKKMSLAKLGKKNSDEANRKKSVWTKGEGNPMYGRRGELAPNWNPNRLEQEMKSNRSLLEYCIWRNKILRRDKRKCQISNDKKSLNVHHFLNYSTNFDVRYDIDNGVTISKDLHTLFHHVYGNRNNTKEQFEQFKQSILNSYC